MRISVYVLVAVLLAGCIDRAFIVPLDEVEYKDYTVTVPFDVSQENARRELASRGLVYRGMPQEDLSSAGYTQEYLLEYLEGEDKSFITYTDWNDIVQGSTVTFVVQNGKVKRWFHSRARSTL